MRKNSKEPGVVTSPIQIVRIGSGELDIMLHGTPVTMSLALFPWFDGAPESAIRNVREVRPNHFHWEELDVDLTADMIRNPQRYPEVAPR